jgi:hypothetical protein
MSPKKLFELLTRCLQPQRNSSRTANPQPLAKIGKPVPKPIPQRRVGIEPLETRIAPATVGLPTLSIDNVSHAEGDSGQTIFHFTVTLSAPSAKAVTVDYLTVNGTATGSTTAGSGDFDAISKTTLTIPAGATTAEIDVTVNGDTTLEQDETFTLQLTNPKNATVDSLHAKGTGTILNDDAPNIILSSVSMKEGDLGNTDMVFTVQLSAPTTHDVTVHWATSDGTAVAGTDYEASFGDVTIPGGDGVTSARVTSATFSVHVKGNLDLQANRSFSVDLSNASNANITAGHATGAILDDDTPTVSIVSTKVAEGAGNAEFTVTLSKAINQDIDVPWSTADGTAKSGTDSPDYKNSSGTVHIEGGKGLISGTLSVPIYDNTTAEPDKTFVVNLATPVHATLSNNSQATGTILNDDAPNMTISDVTIVEGNSGTKTALFTVTLSEPMATDVTVHWATANGTATSGTSADYLATEGDLTIPGGIGQLSATIPVTINADTIKELNETFFLKLSDAVGAKLDPNHAQGTCSILDDDGATLVDSHTLTYTDAAGDLVTIKTNKGTFGDPSKDLSMVETSDGCYQLNSIKLDSSFQGADLTFSATPPSPGGAVHPVNVGLIDATGVDLGNVTLPGDLGKILAGDNLATPGLASLQVDSLGAKGTSTGASDLLSTIQGPVGRINVLNDVDHATLSVMGVTSKASAGSIGSLTIGGSLIGGDAESSGKIYFTGILGTAEIGSIHGGAGASSGMILGDSSHGLGNITKIFVDGNLSGGTGTGSGQISAAKIASATVLGNLQGGTGADSGEIHGGTKIGLAAIHGSILGGAGEKSGSIQCSITTQTSQTSAAITTPGDIKQILLDGDLKGGTGKSSGLIFGRSIATVAIKGDLLGGDGSDSGEISATTLGSAIVGVAGSDHGGEIVGGTGANSGSVRSLGAMGNVKVFADLHGGSGADSGQIDSNGPLASVTVMGSVLGGAGLESGSIQSWLALGSASIWGDLKGGAGSFSGEIFSATNLASVSVLGSVFGGDGESSGIITSSANIGSIKIAHDLVGGTHFGAGSIFSSGKIASVTIAGLLEGGDGDNTGSIFSGADPVQPGAMGKVFVGSDVQGGKGANSGQINCGGDLAKLTIVGNLLGNSGDSSGSIVSFGSLGTIQIAKDAQGGTGADSGAISSGFKIASVSIGGSLLGAEGAGSGAISSHTVFGPDRDLQGDIGAINVSEAVIGNSGNASGQINAAGALGKVNIGQSLQGGSGDGSGCILSGTDAVTSGAIGTIVIGGDLVGGSVSGSDSLEQSGYISGQQIAKITVGGSVIAGVNDGTGTLGKSGSIRAEDSLGILQVKGGLVGNASNPVIIAARGQAVKGATTDLALASLTVGTTVQYANILAGYDSELNPVNGDGQIGAIKVLNSAVNGVKQDVAWTASSVAAGIYDAKLNGFGTRDNAVISEGNTPAILSKIASIQIAGGIAGTPDQGGDHFGFVAQQIGSFKLGTTSLSLSPGGANDAIDPLGGASDVSLREIAS